MLPMGKNEAAQVQRDADYAIYAVATTFAVENQIWDVLRSTSSFRADPAETVVGQITALVYRTKDMARAGSVSEAAIPDDQFSFLAAVPLAVIVQMGDRLRGILNPAEVYVVKTIEASYVYVIGGILERRAVY